MNMTAKADEIEIVATKSHFLTRCQSLAEQAGSGGYSALREEIKDMNETLQGLLPKMTYEDAEEVMRIFYPMLFDGMKEIAETNEEIIEELEFTADTTFTLKIEEADLNLTFRIRDSKFEYEFADHGDWDLLIRGDKAILLKLMTGQTEGMEAYMSGQVEAEGEMMACMGLRAIFEHLGDIFGFRIMEFE